MVSVHESPDLRPQDSDQPSSPSVENDQGFSLEAPRPLVRRRFFTVFLISSLIFHVGLIWIMASLDLRSVASWTNQREIPVELVNEEQAQKDEKKGASGKAGSADAEDHKQARKDHSDGESKEAPAKPVASPEKPEEKSQAQKEKPAEQAKPAADKPPEDQPKTAAGDKPKPAETKQTENKPPESKSTETKAARNAPHSPRTASQNSPPAPKETAAKEEAQKPPVQEPPKAASPAPQQAAARQVQAQSPQLQQTQQPQSQQPQSQPQHEPPPSQNSAQQSQQALQQAAQQQQRSQLPLFYQPNDRLSLAVPAPMPTNDADAEPVSYKLIVFAMLERAKEYPQTARERRATGHVVISFAIDDKGQPQNISLIRSSGEPDLDAESLAMIERAAPFPVPPAGAQREFAINVGFGGG